MGASIDEPQWDNRPILNSAHVVTQPERSAKIYADNVGSIGTFFIFSFSWEFHHPNWRTHIFQRGRHTTNQQILWQPNNIRSPRRTTTPQSKAPFGSPGWSAELITPVGRELIGNHGRVASRAQWKDTFTSRDKNKGADSGYRAGRRSWRVLPEAIPKPKLLDVFWL